MKTINSLFKFMPVGQGMFYCGFIDDHSFNFVYDCGTETVGVDIDKMIDDLAFELKGKQLDFVVLSHLHNDHISGVIKLYEKVGFKTIYLPYLGTNADVIQLYLYGAIFLSGSSSRDTNIANFRYLYGLYLNERTDNDLKVEFIAQETINKSDDYSICYKSFTFPEKPIWKFSFFDCHYSHGMLLSLNNKIKECLNDNNVDSINELISIKKIGLIKQIYKDVFGSNELNQTSLILLHHPINYSHANVSTFPFYYQCSHLLYNLRVSTLLTGDIMFNNDLLVNVLLNSCHYPGLVMQIPHHGSKNNWIKSLPLSVLYTYNVIPYGLKNTYNHPYHHMRVYGDNIRIAITEKSFFEYYIRLVI